MHHAPRLLATLAVIALLFVPVVGAARQDPIQAGTKSVNVELILDASGSMAEPLASGETRIEAARRILRDVIDRLPEREGVNVGFRVYGHRGDNTEAGKSVSCGASELLVPVRGVDKQALRRQIDAFQPTGWTPIAFSLEQAARDFEPGGESITNVVVLVTDGEETCDPPDRACAAAAALRRSDVTVTTHVVGFALTPAQTELVRCVAEEGGGRLFDAPTAEELGGALISVLAELAVVPAATPPIATVPLADIRTLVYHQITAWDAAPSDYDEQQPILSDDGQRIAFTRAPGTQDPANPNRIFVVNADGSGEREIDAYTTLCFCGSILDISADGGRVVSSDYVQLRIADGNGGGGRELIAFNSNEINAVRISGDGSKVFFRLRRGVNILNTSPIQSLETGVYVINADGSGLRQLAGPTQLGGLLGIAPEQIVASAAIWGLDASTDGSRVVFGSYTADIDPATGNAREGLFAVNGDGSGLRKLLGPDFTYVLNGAISGDGATVAYVTGDFATGYQEAGVLGFDGSGRRKLTDNTTRRPGTGGNLPSGDRMQLTADGSRLLLGSSGVLYDTAGSGAIALGVGTPSVSGDPTPLVVDGLYRATMNRDATRFVYVFQPFGEPYQLARLDLNPGDLGGAPSVTEASVTPPFVLTDGRSTATLSAQASTSNPFLRVGSRVLRNGLPDDTVYQLVLADDGTAGDTAAGDGLFANTTMASPCCAEVGPRTMRIKAETQAGDGLRHATAVDFGPFAVASQATLGAELKSALEQVAASAGQGNGAGTPTATP